VGVLARRGAGRQTDEDSGDTGGWGFASSTESETWASFEAALEYTETEHADGVGFVFTDDDPIVGVDLDDCRDPETGDVDDAALDIIKRLDSYTEVSPSGTGYHVLIRGELPEGGIAAGASNCTTRHAFSPSLATTSSGHQRALHAVRTRLWRFTASTSRTPSVTQHPSPNTMVALTTSHRRPMQPTLTSTLKTRTSSRKRRNASNGEKFERLWNGNTVGYDSQSEADMALCCLLAFWTGGDRTQMDHLFRQSGLLREKWDEVHYADGSTYGEKTIERAIATTSEFYDPDAGDDTADDTPGGSSPDVGAADSERSRAYLCREESAIERARRRTRGDTHGENRAHRRSRSGDRATH